jgi:hypothetical protein
MKTLLETLAASAIAGTVLPALIAIIWAVSIGAFDLVEVLQYTKDSSGRTERPCVACSDSLTRTTPTCSTSTDAKQRCTANTVTHGR